MDWDKLSDRFFSFGEGAGRWLKGLFGSRTERMVRQLHPLVARVAELEAWAKGLPAEKFPEKTAEWKRALAEGKVTLEDILPEAFALVREASVRTLGLRHYDVQIVGGIVLHRGMIAEMMTGEGKTLVATLPLYLNCLSGKPCYLVTVNDYLARRDAFWMGPIYDYLGVSVGAIQSDMEAWERVPVYACDVVYGTNNEFGFDYLRDNMKTRLADQVQKTLHYAIVDEVDSILIDEARTPLIISGPAEEATEKYAVANRVAQQLVRDEHFEVKEKERQVALLEAGIELAEKLVGVDSFYTAGNMDWPHYIENALRAHHLYKRDVEYVVEPAPEREGARPEPGVVIVDEFTGRKMHGRRWSDGLHQAVETKEGLRVRQENQTLATITFQNYFRLYAKLAGMTGTALTEANEFFKIYGLEVVSIPTNLPVARADYEDVVYRTEPEKWKAISEEIARAHGAGQPILVGTTSVEKSEKLSGILNRRGIRHEVLNAKNHEREAAIVSRAGEKSAVTVSTNMAGRGTDIKLGGNFEFRLRHALEERGLREGDPEKLVEVDAVRKELRAQCDKDEAEVLGCGGLYVLGTERHEARRIDNQLRGRTGRQGDVGTSRFYLSLEDDLMRRFYRDWVKNFMAKLGMTEDVPIESRMVTNAIRRAQKKVEDYHFEVRKSLLEYDEVMDQQRKTIYGVRQQVLEGVELREKSESMLVNALERAAGVHKGEPERLQAWFQRTFGAELPRAAADKACEPRDPDLEPAEQALHARYDAREAEHGAELMRKIEGYLLMQAIDTRWKDHLHAIDALKHGIGLRGYAQRDPKNEYKQEAFGLFQRLFAAIEEHVASLLLRLEVGGAPGTRAAGAAPTTPRSSGPNTPGAGPAGPSGSPGRPMSVRDIARVPAASAFDQFAAHKRAQEALRPAGPAGSATAPAAAPVATGDGSPAPQAPAAQPVQPHGASAPQRASPAVSRSAGAAFARSAPASAGSTGAAVVGRNDPCPCGSGQKYKKCHGKGA